MLVIVATHSGYLSALFILPTLRGNPRHRPGRLQCTHGHREHRRRRKLVGPCWLLSASASTPTAAPGCAPTMPTSLAKEVSVDQDPLNLIWLAAQLKDMIVFPYLIIIAIIFAFFCLILLAASPGWHEEDSKSSERNLRPIPPRAVSQVALAIIFIASIFVLVSVLWQHTASVVTASVAASIIAQDFGNGAVKSGVGTSAMVMGWFSFTLLISSPSVCSSWFSAYAPSAS